MLGRASAQNFRKTPGLEQDALSLSHLTYRFATITVNFHRLDHPPFPCGLNVSAGWKEIKLLQGTDLSFSIL